MTYFFDRNFGKNLPTALRLLGLSVEYHAERFGERKEVSDDYWLEYCGINRLTVFAHDKRFQQNQSEIDAIAHHRVACFVLGEANGTRWAKVRLLALTWDRILELERTEPAPYIFRIYGNGEFRRVFPPLLPDPKFDRKAQRVS